MLIEAFKILLRESLPTEVALKCVRENVARYWEEPKDGWHIIMSWDNNGQKTGIHLAITDSQLVKLNPPTLKLLAEMVDDTRTRIKNSRN